MTRWMPCSEFVEFLDQYLAGTLPAEQAAEFNDHLSGCPPCVVYMRSYQETTRLGRAVLERSETPTPEALPEGLVEAILVARKRTVRPR
jgi:anti-sigma factor RsiW